MKLQDDQQDLPFYLLVKKWEGTISEPEQTELETWLAASPDHPGMAEAARRAWLAAERYGEAVPFEAEADFESINRRIEAAENRETPGTTRLSGRLTGRVWWAAAAAVLLVAVAVVVFRTVDRLPSTTIICENSDRQEVRLPDSTRVWLRRGARLDYPVSFEGQGERRVTLSGEAFFEVRHLDAQPFRVETGQAAIVVLGTAFNVQADPSEPETSVLVRNGKVRFSSADGSRSQVLTAGNKAVLDHAGKRIDVIAAADPNEIAWQSDELVFRNEPLGKVLEQLGPWYGKKFSLTNGAMADCPVSGRFKKGDFDNAGLVLKTVLSVELTATGDTILIGGEGCR